MASATTVVYLSQERVTPGTGLEIYIPTDNRRLTAEAGNYILNVNPTAPKSGILISGYCVDPSYSSQWFQEYTELPITTALNTTSEPNGYAGFAAAAWIVSKGYTGTAAVTAQAAVWELTWDYVYGKPFDLSANNFRLYSSSSAETDVKNIYYAALEAVNHGFVPSAYVIYHNGQYQDFVAQHVPVPPSVLLMGSGLLGLGLLGYRRKRG